MPKFFYEEGTFREYASLAEEDREEGQPPLFDLEDVLAKFKREPDGQLSSYDFAQCSIKREDLPEESRLALEELSKARVKQLFVDYDGGNDEGFTHFRAAHTEQGVQTLEQLAHSLEAGPLGETPLAQPKARHYYLRDVPQQSRFEWALFRLDELLYELASQLLGHGFGVGEFSIAGTFTADLETNILTDVAPEEE